MLKRTHYIALGLVVLLTLVVLNLPASTTARLKLAIGSLFLPLFGLAGGAHQAASKAGDALTPRNELLRANERLRSDNQQLRLQATQAEEIARENDRLRQLLGWQKQKPWKLKLAHVLLRDPANWWRTVQIDRGTLDGLSNNIPVLTADGFLVGRVASVSLTRSQVILIGDANCKVAALIENDARDTGVIVSSGPLDGSFVSMSFLAHSANVKPGQNVVTSGLGGFFPKGIPLGKIIDARPVESGLYTEAQVKLSANLNSLEEVWVLFP